MTRRLSLPLLLLLAACGEKDVRPFDLGAREHYVPLAETPIPGAGTGTTDYVASRLGSDANDGRSEGAPLATVSAVNALALAPGDTVAFRCGDAWRDDPLVVTWSGTEAAYVTITSWPAGCADRPALLGSQPITGWAVPEAAMNPRSLP
jgi:hypothetical protein